MHNELHEATATIHEKHMIYKHQFSLLTRTKNGCNWIELLNYNGLTYFDFREQTNDYCNGNKSNTNSACAKKNNLSTILTFSIITLDQSTQTPYQRWTQTKILNKETQKPYELQHYDLHPHLYHRVDAMSKIYQAYRRYKN